jgi:hypothetical protein
MIARVEEDIEGCGLGGLRDQTWLAMLWWDVSGVHDNERMVLALAESGLVFKNSFLSFFDLGFSSFDRMWRDARTTIIWGAVTLISEKPSE